MPTPARHHRSVGLSGTIVLSSGQIQISGPPKSRSGRGILAISGNGLDNGRIFLDLLDRSGVQYAPSAPVPDGPD
jgi:hypothetical protein